MRGFVSTAGFVLLAATTFSSGRALAGPVPLDTRGHAAGLAVDEVESCAREQSFEIGRIAGKLLKVTTPEATLTYSPAGVGGTAFVGIAAPKGTPKDERAAARERGRTHSDALWECALAALDASQADRDAALEAERAEKEARQAERQQQRAANLERLQGMMQATQEAGARGNLLTSEPASPASPASDSDAAFSGSCCINGAFHACPSLEAVNRCSGDFMRCQTSCGFDMSCLESCSESHPLDPSMCSRAPSRDGECK